MNLRTEILNPRGVGIGSQEFYTASSYKRFLCESRDNQYIPSKRNSNRKSHIRNYLEMVINHKINLSGIVRI